MTEVEMKNRISFALKDPMLQQGFEIICKEIAELKKRNGELAGQKASLERWFGEAKEIIKKFLLWENDWHSKAESKYELLKQAEQFINEMEDD